jgi:hypothetical protein
MYTDMIAERSYRSVLESVSKPNATTSGSHLNGCSLKVGW